MAKEKENLKVLKLNELEAKLVDLRESVRVSRFKAGGAKTKNVKEQVTLRKQVARVLTEIRRIKQ
jgi:ribosomal protein L29